MALLHRAQLQPSKTELISGWLAAQPWFVAASSTDGELEKVASFRFDDPAGEVGIETLLVCAGGGPVMQVPLTYRASPLDGAEASLIGTMEHSVLGTRWTYDGCGDPVYLAALANAIVTGGSEAEQYYEVDGVRTTKPDSTHVRGSGAPGSSVPSIVDAVVSTNGAGTPGSATLIQSAGCRLSVIRYPVASEAQTDATDGLQSLIGSWDGLEGRAVLATMTVRG